MKELKKLEKECPDSQSLPSGPQAAEIKESGRFSEEELTLIELAIRQHNAYTIKEGLSERELLFCNIIRDADKVDIFRVNVNTPMEVIYGSGREELLKSTITPEVMDSFRERHCILRSLKKSPDDNLVGHIALVLEL